MILVCTLVRCFPSKYVDIMGMVAKMYSSGNSAHPDGRETTMDSKRDDIHETIRGLLQNFGFNEESDPGFGFGIVYDSEFQECAPTYVKMSEDLDWIWSIQRIPFSDWYEIRNHEEEEEQEPMRVPATALIYNIARDFFTDSN